MTGVHLGVINPNMYKHLIFLIFALNSLQNSRQDINHPRIINGKPISIESVPSQTSLFRRSSFICGAVLIGRRTAITAGHCVINIQYQPKLFELHYGSSNVSSLLRVSVARIELFPAYSTATLNYDLAVLTLASSIYVPYAVLPEIGKSIIPGTVLTSVGWGTTELGSTSVQLLMTHLVTISNEQCREVNPNWLVSDNMFCAQGTGTTTCKGDSGGGVYIAERTNSKLNVLLGLVSWGDNRCSSNPARPAGFVDLTNRDMRDWLRLVTI